MKAKQSAVLGLMEKLPEGSHVRFAHLVADEGGALQGAPDEVVSRATRLLVDFDEERMPRSPARGVTYACVKDAEHGVLAEAIARCSEEEQTYSRRHGRIVSLGRVLAELDGRAARRRERGPVPRPRPKRRPVIR